MKGDRELAPFSAFVLLPAGAVLTSRMRALADAPTPTPGVPTDLLGFGLNIPREYPHASNI